VSFQQQVLLKNINPFDVIRSFHDLKFVEFLIAGQPIRINLWEGIDNNKKASFSFWFFGWKTMNVVHEKYLIGKDHLYFEDRGTELPFGLNLWQHKHTVKPYDNGTVIVDTVLMDDSTPIKKFLIYPIMIFPILIRRVTYKIWFYYLNSIKGIK
jgi:hypothetical protein